MASSKEIELHRQLLSSSVSNFTKKMFAYLNNNELLIGKHHKIIFDALNRIVSGENNRLIINVPPRYGKTLLVSQMFLAYGLAINPKSRFILLSYSGSLAMDNSIAVKQIVKSDYYQLLFDTRVKQGSDTKARWDTEQGGGVYATTPLGQVTGFGAGRIDSDREAEDFEIRETNEFAGAIVIDDPIKPEDALSDTIRETVNRRFETTIRNRVNSRKTPIIIIMQRLHEHDLCGYLQEIEGEDWETISLPALSYDKNGNEVALWDFKHTVEELHKLKRTNEFVFETQYQQNPTPMEGLMYKNIKTYDVLPVGKGVRRNYTDTADTGADWLCSICYIEYETALYVTDVLYTKKPMEYTEPETARMLVANETEEVLIESNNGGRGFARNVEQNVRKLGNGKMMFQTFTQSLNKEVRIFSHSAEVQNLILFPTNWKRMWPEFSHDVISYRKEGKNLHDDGPDVLTGMIEYYIDKVQPLDIEKINEIFF